MNDNETYFKLHWKRSAAIISPKLWQCYRDCFHRLFLFFSCRDQLAIFYCYRYEIVWVWPFKNVKHASVGVEFKNFKHVRMDGPFLNMQQLLQYFDNFFRFIYFSSNMFKFTQLQRPILRFLIDSAVFHFKQGCFWSFEYCRLEDPVLSFSRFLKYFTIFFRFYEFLSKAFAVSQLGRSICCFSTNLKVSCFGQGVLKFLNIGG